VVSPGYVQSGTNVYGQYISAWNGATPTDQGVGEIKFIASQTHTSSQFGTYLSLVTTANGATSRTESLRLLGAQAYVNAGSAAAPGLAFLTDSLSGVAAVVSNSVSLISNSQELLRAVSGSLLLPTASASNGIWLGSTASNTSTAFIGTQGSAGTLRMSVPNTASMQFLVESGAQMDLSAQGIQFVDGFAYDPTTVSAATYSMTASQCAISSTYSQTGSSIITLPNPSLIIANPGQIVTIMDAGGLAGTNHIAVTPYGTTKINGSNSATNITTNFGVLRLMLVGGGQTDWIII
jgi:hypothetical protein